MLIVRIFNLMEKNMSYIMKNKKKFPKDNELFNKQFDESFNKNVRETNDYIKKKSSSIHNTKK